eukprot:1147004-Pelagomonas_calceolata.AAC.6
MPKLQPCLNEQPAGDVATVERHTKAGAHGQAPTGHLHAHYLPWPTHEVASSIFGAAGCQAVYQGGADGLHKVPGALEWAWIGGDMSRMDIGRGPESGTDLGLVKVWQEVWAHLGILNPSFELGPSYGIKDGVMLKLWKESSWGVFPE